MNSLEKLEREFNEIAPYASGRSLQFLELIAKILIEVLRELRSKD